MAQRPGRLAITTDRGTTEHDTFTCCHCQQVILAAQGQFCSKCMSVQCEHCAGKPCRPLEAWLHAMENPRGAFELRPLDEAMPLPERRAVQALLHDDTAGKAVCVVWDARLGAHLLRLMNEHEVGRRYSLRPLGTLDDRQLAVLGAARQVVLNKMAGKAACLAFEEPTARTLTALLNLEQPATPRVFA